MEDDRLCSNQSCTVATSENKETSAKREVLHPCDHPPGVPEVIQIEAAQGKCTKG